eukprot:SAG25_NODE_66_length_17563_cov_34.737918_19_plen_54_part_00
MPVLLDVSGRWAGEAGGDARLAGYVRLSPGRGRGSVCLYGSRRAGPSGWRRRC